MDSPPTKEEPQWNPHTLETIEHPPDTRSLSPKSDPERRHSSSASTTTYSTGDGTDPHGTRGRRSRPSVTASSVQLPTVKEMKERKGERHLSTDSTGAAGSVRDRPSVVSMEKKKSSEEVVISSKKVLTSFSKVVARNAEKEDARQRQLNHFNEENDVQKRVHQRLVKWHETQYKSLKEYLLSWAFPKYREAPLPHTEELKSLARHYYTPRAELKCHVCDFGDGRAEHKVVDLGQLEEYLIVKPDWIDVRWVHAPLGLGLMHSSIEDIFLHEGIEGRTFENAGRSGWPYLETEIFNFRHRDNFQEMRDVYILLSKMEELNPALNESTWKADRNASLHHDINWRADHLAVEPTYWNLVSSDMPWQLGEGLSMGSLGPKDGLKPVGRRVEKQTLSMHPFYKDANLVRDPFRAFHRGDGFLLTLSPMAGINYLDKNFATYLADPIDAMFDNDDASALGHSFQAFANSGTSTWHRRSVEWFLIYLLTEVGTTPHPYRQGFNAPALDSVYSSVIQDLKRRRFDEWKPKITVTLVREYLACLDELTYISLSWNSKVHLFKVIQEDVKKFEAEDSLMNKLPNNAEGESMMDRLTWAYATARQQHECFERLLIDLKQSLDALFQLRSIEQNDMAIVSDSQNKAIIVFTGVTIVFLPLSFFTSYFGMNLQGIVDTTLSQSYFWKVCGSVGLIIVIVVTLGAFRHELRRNLRRRVGKAQRAMV